MKIAIIGTGLIGGSIALDIKSIYDNAIVFGIDSDENHLEQALQLGIIDQKTTINELTNADFVILAVPVDIGLVILPDVLNVIGEETLVFDVGSTKLPICQVIENHKNRRNFFGVSSNSGNRIFGTKRICKRVV
jgi:prephenate dehydrogenase